MTTQHRGVFATIDGLGGAGKSTVTRQLEELLTARGYCTHITTQPSRSPLGELARHETDRYSGRALACLIAADRYHHLATEIRPKLAENTIVVCDRYVASSYVLQRMDGVPSEFIDAINAAADVPDLAVILTAHPATTAQRIQRRGAHSRFESGIESSQAEADYYSDAYERLAAHGYPLLTIDTTSTAPEAVATRIAEHVMAVAGPPTGT